MLSARASELDRDFPFGVVRQLFEPPVLRSPDGSRLLRGAAAGAAPLLGAGPLGAPAPAVPAHALYWLTANLAEQAPVALAIDDVHWADDGSLRFLRFLLPRLDELPVLVVLAARSAEPRVDRRALDAVATDPLTTVLRPAPLSDDAVATLAGRLGEAVDRRFSDACRQATGGNPFLVRELLRELQADGVAPDERGVPLVRELAPPTVARVVVVRLARLGEDAAALARAVAVLGDGTPLRRAAELAGLSVERATAAAAALGDADVLAPARPLAFAHPILRAAVRADLDAGELASAHRRAAALLAEEGVGPGELAVHLLATEPAADAFVVATLREAAGLAAARGAAPTAVAFLRRALAEPPGLGQRGEIAFELACAEVEAGAPAAAADHFEEGVRLTSDPRSRGERALRQATALMAAGRGEEAIPLLERAERDVAAIDPEMALVLEANMLGMARAVRSQVHRARERLERRRGRLTGATPGERLLLAVLAHIDAFSRSSRASAAELAAVAERVLADGGLLPEAGDVSPPLFFALDVLLLADRLDAARRVLDHAVEDARRRGSLPGFAFASGMRCGLLARAGDLAGAEADGRSSAELLIDQGWFLVQPNGLGSLIGVLVDRGELDDAARIDAQLRAEEVPGADLALTRVTHARARLLAARHDHAGARAEIERLGRPRSRWNTYPVLTPWVLVDPALVADRPEEARTDARRTLVEARTWDTPRAVGMALHACALTGAARSRLGLLEEAAAVLATAPAPLEEARALADLGAELRRSGRRAAARDPLRRALDLANACGARPLADRARHELRAAGGRPRRPRISGVDALTASERRIASMAADGLSNPEIAQALFVTTKTVESHLSNAYRKLGIASRGQLREALAAER